MAFKMRGPMFFKSALKHTYGTQYENQELTQDQKDHNASSHPHDNP